ncbi:MAG: sulfur carrier protein ThiS [Moraxellaceae bacterium]|nr:sulfur carrier protein ThiS [Moraxellaceae bacterium]MDP1776126.1 sulfur carrier protein ThiS [Moraxellaceae bacterium]MDZ4297230.1 sulfur carrier protein ThiS [Moraxellaceae bacterium]MDZ4386210.1 sulfur carrier protein ThiS [Moraxellaceae bacterium]
MANAFRISVNGQPQEVAEGATVADLLLLLNVQGRRIAVERNGDIVPRSLHASTLIHPADQIEVVHAIGGG